MSFYTISDTELTRSPAGRLNPDDRALDWWSASVSGVNKEEHLNIASLGSAT